MNDNSRLDPPARVLVTKIGLDGHDRGSRIVAAYLRDAGMEVIYTPPWQTIEGVVKLATEEDVDVIGLSSLATDHLIIPQFLVALRNAERPSLIEAGVKGIFGPGSLRATIVDQVAETARKARQLRNASLWESIR
jgi:methylmalonyl-CoA mutase C-terminal domain/subunit